MFIRIARVSISGLGLAALLSLAACQPSLTAVLPARPQAPTVAVERPEPPKVTAAVASSGSSGSSGASPGSEDLDKCPSSSSLPGQRPETYTGSNNSPFSARTDPEPTGCEIARENKHRWTRLVGYSIEEAKKRAKAAGWEGKIEVRELPEYDAKCKAGLVCTFQPARWEIGAGSELTLYINHKMTISTPD